MSDNDYINENNVDVDKIINFINKLLTGDDSFDVPFLIKVYDDIPDNLKDLKDAIWDLMYEKLPERIKMKISPDGTKRGSTIQHVGQDYTEIPENVLNHKPETLGELTLDAIIKAQKAIEEGNNAKAFLEIASTLEALDNEGILEDSFKKRERNFNHPIEREYIRLMEPDDRPEGDAQIARLFYRSGFLMNEIGRLSEAEKELQKSLLWDPSDFGTLLELANTYKGLNRPGETFVYAEQALNYAFEPTQIAAAWRSMGFALIELELYNQAAACFHESLRYEPYSDVAQSELDYISFKSGIGIPEKNMDDTIEFANKLKVDLKKPYKMYKFLDKVAKESDDENLRKYAEEVSKDLKPRVEELLKEIDEASVELVDIDDSDDE